MSKLFRPAAVAAYGRDEIGRMLAVGLRSRPLVYAAVGVLLISVGLACLIPLNDHAWGRAIVRVAGSRVVKSYKAGRVERVLAGAGQHVRNGQSIMTLERQTLRAPIDGVLTDVRVRIGSYAEADEPLFTVEPEGGEAEVIAVLSGIDGSQLGVTQRARFAAVGSTRYVDAQLRVISTDLDEVNELVRILGLGRAGRQAGPSDPARWVAVVAHLEHDGFHQGMSGELEITLEPKPLLFLLFPQLDGIPRS
jgi:multidrug efflux pump subunit AcrA (membrane-fusion protein)